MKNQHFYHLKVILTDNIYIKLNIFQLIMPFVFYIKISFFLQVLDQVWDQQKVLATLLLPEFQCLSQFLLLKAEYTLLEMAVEVELAVAATAS